ncbi:hypothetical protein T190_31075 [Sinorhizobium meliloti CCBAU 01290]|nr:hypothetical protein T190_31075 [Sinorhizobium meliloti CCBAU 01290]
MFMRLAGHVGLVETGDNIYPVANSIETTSQKADFRLLAPDHQPCEDEQNTEWWLKRPLR